MPLFKSPEKLVYLIGNKRDGLIKIGVSQNVEKRLKDLQSVYKTPLEIIATKRGSFDAEKELHKKFSQFRRHGEWFIWDDSIVQNF
ncbi:MAG: GIY-YIG nuclease family protein [Xenococcaceae cyanobacterium]